MFFIDRVGCTENIVYGEKEVNNVSYKGQLEII